MPRVVEGYVEFMKWKEDAVASTALSVVRCYSEFLSDYGTASWEKQALDYMTCVLWGTATQDMSAERTSANKGKARQALKLKGRGLQLVFRPPSTVTLPGPETPSVRAVPPIMLHYNIPSEEVSLREHQDIIEASMHIMGHAARLYYLDLSTDPLRLVYPKSTYGEKFRVKKLPLLV